jgi:vacuolar-type H+-ATPase subunit E/Vma4
MRKEDLKKPIKEGLADLADMAERDHEVQMARADLYKIAKYAIKLHEMLKGVSEKEGLEGWVQSKITKASDYIGSVYHHLDYETRFESEISTAVESAEYKDALRKRLQEKAVSKAQQRLMGMAYAYKQGELDDASEEVKKLANSMSLKDLEDFASTKHAGKPEHVEEGVLDYIKDKLGANMEEYDNDMKTLRRLAGDGPDAKSAEFGCNNDPRICLIKFIRKNDLDPKGLTKEIEARL